MNIASSRILTAALAASVMTAAAAALAALPGRVLAAASEAPRSLVFAAYDDESSAKRAFDLLRQAEKNKVIDIESYAVVSKDMKGKVTVKDQRKKGTRAGAAVGALVGLVGGPLGVAIGAGAGGAAGYLTGNAVGMPKEVVEQIKAALGPGQSAVVAAVEEKWVQRVAQDLRSAEARRIIEHSIPAVTTEGGSSSTGNPPGGDMPPRHR